MSEWNFEAAACYQTYPQIVQTVSAQSKPGPENLGVGRPFVNRYQLELPSKEEMQCFLERQLKDEVAP